MKDSCFVFWYGISVEIYIGFRLVFTFPQLYPQFKWIFPIVHSFNNYRTCLIEYLCFLGNYPHVFILCGLISISATAGTHTIWVKQNNKKEAR